MTDHSQPRFWETFISKTRAYAVSPRATTWYARHVEAYIKANPELRLKQHSSGHLEACLRDKGRNTRPQGGPRSGTR